MKFPIVDEDVDLLRMLEKVRVQRGHEVHACATSFSVSAHVLREQPRVVVLDVMMPALSGSALAEIVQGLGLATKARDEGSRLGLPVASKTQRPSHLVDFIEEL